MLKSPIQIRLLRSQSRAATKIAMTHLLLQHHRIPERASYGYIKRVQQTMSHAASLPATAAAYRVVNSL